MPLLTTQSSRGYGFGTALASLSETNAYWALGDVTVPANTSSVEIASIPTTGYTHLEIRGVWTNNHTGTSSLKFTLNNDTGANYRTHYTFGNGNTLGAGNYSGGLENHGFAAYFGTTADGSYDGTSFVLKIPDYTSTTKKRSFQSIEGRANTASSGNHGEINHGVYKTTGSAITSIQFSTTAGVIGANSRFSVYGIKG
jgi:hypothetical protein